MKVKDIKIGDCIVTKKGIHTVVYKIEETRGGIIWVNGLSVTGHTVTGLIWVDDYADKCCIQLEIF